MFHVCGHVFHVSLLSQLQPPQGKPPKSPAPSKPSHPHHSHPHHSHTVRKTHSPRIREPVRTRGIYKSIPVPPCFHSTVHMFPTFHVSKFHTPFGHVSIHLFPILPFPCFRASVFAFSKLPFPMFPFPFTHVPIPTFPFFHSHVLNPLCFQTPIHPCSQSLSPMFPNPHSPCFHSPVFPGTRSPVSTVSTVSSASSRAVSPAVDEVTMETLGLRLGDRILIDAAKAASNKAKVSR